MTSPSPELQAGHKTADDPIARCNAPVDRLRREIASSHADVVAVLAKRTAIADEARVLVSEQRAAADRLRVAKQELKQREDAASRGDPTAVGLAIKARQRVADSERTVVDVDNRLAGMGERSQIIDTEIADIRSAHSASWAAFKAAIPLAFQDEIATAVRGQGGALLEILQRAHAVSNAIGGLLRAPLEEFCIPKFAATYKVPGTEVFLRDPMINGHSARMEGDEPMIWSRVAPDPELLTLYTAAQELERQFERVEAEIRAADAYRIANDEAYREERLQQRREETQRRNDDVRRRLEQQAATKSQRPWNTTEYHQPQNSLEVRRPANMADAVAGAGDRAERIADSL